MSVSFSESLRGDNANIWNRILNHSFFVEITACSLPISKFIFYLGQDRLFLRTFRNLLVNASRIAYSKEAKILIENLIESIIQYEMPLQEELLRELKVNDIGSVAIPIHKSTINYASYLTKVSLSKDLNLIISAVAPCPWTYYEISETLMRKKIRSTIVKKWLQFYSSDESRIQLNQLKKLLDNMGRKVDNNKKSQMRYHFSVSCEYEMEFWNMVYGYSD